MIGGLPHTPGDSSGCGPLRSMAAGIGLAIPGGGEPMTNCAVNVLPWVALAMLPITLVFDKSRGHFIAADACHAISVTGVGGPTPVAGLGSRSSRSCCAGLAASNRTI